MGYTQSLRNFVNESSKLTNKVIDNRNLNKKKLDVVDGAIIGLYEQILQKSEDLCFLIENKRFATSNIILRVIFEEYIYLLFILDKRKHTDSLAKSYFYKSKLIESKIYEELIKDTDLGKQIREKLGYKNIDDLRNDLNSKINNPKHNSYEDYYDSIKVEYQKLQPNTKEWYNYNGKTKNFRDLCKHLDEEHMYVLVYKVLSSNVHGNRPNEAISIVGDSAYITDIQSNNEMLVASIISQILYTLNKLIFKHYDMDPAWKNYKSTVGIKYSYHRNKLELD